MTNGWKPPKGSQLTKYEIRVLDLVAQGKSNLEICKVLGKTPGSVSTCKCRIKTKLDIKGDLVHAVLAEQYRQLHNHHMYYDKPDDMDDLRYRIQKALGR